MHPFAPAVVGFPARAVPLLLTLACATSAGKQADPARAPAPAARSHAAYLGTKTHLVTYAFDVETGALLEKDRIAMGVRTVYVAVSPDRRHLYASHGEAPGKVIAFAIDPVTGALTRLNDASTSDQDNATGTSHVAVHPSGKWVMTAHLASGRVSMLPIGADGRVGPPSDTRILAVGAHYVLTDRAGKFAFIPVRDGGYVAQFLVDAQAGKLTANTPATVPSAVGAGPRQIAFHPGEHFAYACNESNGTVTAYRHDQATGRLTPLQTVPSVPAEFKETGMAHIEVHRNGKFVYASNRFHNSIVAYAIDQQTGSLRLLEIETGGNDIRFPRDFTIDPSGRLMLVANERGDSVLVLRIEPDGRLTRIGAPVPAPLGPQVVVVVPLGAA
jgi:6-phosphogluconolactonase